MTRKHLHARSEIRNESKKDIDQDPLFTACRETLAYAHERDYTGWDYADGLSSDLLARSPVQHKWLNLAVQEGIKRAPINLRPLFLVEQRRNYKGAALFVMTNLDAYALTGEDHYAREASKLADWLSETRVETFSGFCGGGHRHPIQKLGETSPELPGETSGVVSTAYAVQALLRYADTFDKPEYAELVRSAPDFVFEDLQYTEIEEGARINYTPGDTDAYTINANAVGARLFVELYDRFGDQRLLDAATAIMDYVAAKQTALGGWMYMDPPTASHLSMDNHHNGFIVDSFLRYREVTGEDRYDATIDRAMAFYRDELFETDGAPNWDESSSYPRDVHAAATGIVVFTEAGDLDFARRIAEWTLDSLYAGNGRFYYRKQRFYTKRFTLMRWCQAWMAYALSTYLTATDTARSH